MKWLASQSSARLEQYKIESLFESLSKYTIADRTIIEQHKDRVDTFVDNRRT